MREFISCVAIEQGVGLVSIVGLVCALFVLFVEVLFLRTLPRLLRSGVSKIGFKLTEKAQFSAEGHGTAVLVVILMTVVLLTPFGAIWYGYASLKDYYAVAIDAQATDTVESVRETFARDPRSRIKVEIADKVRDFRVRGTFEGVCVADAFDAICQLYTRELKCETRHSDRIVRINAR